MTNFYLFYYKTYLSIAKEKNNNFKIQCYTIIFNLVWLFHGTSNFVGYLMLKEYL